MRVEYNVSIIWLILFDVLNQLFLDVFLLINIPQSKWFLQCLTREK